MTSPTIPTETIELYAHVSTAEIARDLLESERQVEHPNSETHRMYAAADVDLYLAILAAR